jgi:hypothetical protein
MLRGRTTWSLALRRTGARDIDGEPLRPDGRAEWSWFLERRSAFARDFCCPKYAMGQLSTMLLR